MAEKGSMYFRRTGLIGSVGVASILVFPFAGFTERTVSGASTIYRDYGMAGLGTFGEDFNPFEYPAGVWAIQILMLLLAVLMSYPLVRTWRWHTNPETVTTDGLRLISRMTMALAAASVLLVMVALVLVLPSMEEQTIWLTESSGWLTGWWPDYGAYVTALTLAAMALALMLKSRSVGGAASPAPPPFEPPAAETP